MSHQSIYQDHMMMQDRFQEEMILDKIITNTTNLYM